MERPTKRPRIDAPTSHYTWTILDHYSDELDRDISDEAECTETMSKDGSYNVQDPDVELEQTRAQLNRKLKSTFEAIFEKYGKDFSGIGDEIDLETGEIVVNNGHLVEMRNEGDIGDCDMEPGRILTYHDEPAPLMCEMKRSGADTPIRSLKSRVREISREDTLQVQSGPAGEHLPPGSSSMEQINARPEAFPSHAAIVAQFGAQLGPQIAEFISSHRPQDQSHIEPAWQTPFDIPSVATAKPLFQPVFRENTRLRSKSPLESTSVWAPERPDGRFKSDGFNSYAVFVGQPLPKPRKTRNKKRLLDVPMISLDEYDLEDRDSSDEEYTARQPTSHRHVHKPCSCVEGNSSVCQDATHDNQKSDADHIDWLGWPRASLDQATQNPPCQSEGMRLFRLNGTVRNLQRANIFSMPCPHIDCVNHATQLYSLAEERGRRSDLIDHLNKWHHTTPFSCIEVQCTKRGGKGFIKEGRLITHVVKAHAGFEAYERLRGRVDQAKWLRYKPSTSECFSRNVTNPAYDFSDEEGSKPALLGPRALGDGSIQPMKSAAMSAHTRDKWMGGQRTDHAHAIFGSNTRSSRGPSDLNPVTISTYTPTTREKQQSGSRRAAAAQGEAARRKGLEAFLAATAFEDQMLSFQAPETQLSTPFRETEAGLIDSTRQLGTPTKSSPFNLSRTPRGFGPSSKPLQQAEMLNSTQEHSPSRTIESAANGLDLCTATSHIESANFGQAELLISALGSANTLLDTTQPASQISNTTDPSTEADSEISNSVPSSAQPDSESNNATAKTQSATSMGPPHLSVSYIDTQSSLPTAPRQPQVKRTSLSLATPNRKTVARVSTSSRHARSAKGKKLSTNAEIPDSEDVDELSLLGHDDEFSVMSSTPTFPLRSKSAGMLDGSSQLAKPKSVKRKSFIYVVDDVDELE